MFWLPKSTLAAQWAYFTRLKAGRLAAAIAVEVEQAASCMLVLIKGCTAIFQLVVQLVLALMIGWQVTVFGVLVGGLSYGLFSTLVRRTRVEGQRRKEALEALTTHTMEAVAGVKAEFVSEAPKIATRVSSQQVLEKLVPVVPGLIGGSADLTGSNGTLTSHHRDVTANDFSASYIRYGVREHGMAAAMNGIAIHKGFIPYGGTFLVFADYSRPSIRLAALMGIRVVHVLTHDSIGLGEDGPTHQPVETLSALRAIPNVTVIRPADAVETAEAWQAALANKTGPTALILTRQGVPALRSDAGDNQVAKGGYVIRQADGKRRVTIVASGSEVSLANAAAEALAEAGISAAVVSMASMELFAKQPEAYRAETLGTAPRIAVEAAVRQSWDRFLRDGDAFIGMSSFGTSAAPRK